jgi:hypothetical protein
MCGDHLARVPSILEGTARCSKVVQARVHLEPSDGSPQSPCASTASEKAKQTADDVEACRAYSCASRTCCNRSFRGKQCGRRDSESAK